MSVYITSTGAFLPGPAISNEEIEEHLGLIHGKPSRFKRRILKSNGIKTRHYAIDKDHETKFSNAEMAANAGDACLEDSFLSKKQLAFLSCATSQGDFVLPGFGSMVQAKMNIPNIELNTSHGICSSSMMALKSAFMFLKAEEHENALVIASELASRLFKASRYEEVSSANAIDFDAEFLRWMLSDGAGSLLLERKKRPNCLKIEWIRGFSHANAFPVCMSVGKAPSDTRYHSWQDYPSYKEAESDGALLIRQNTKLLENVVKLGVDGFLKVLQMGLVKIDEIDHVLCHYSSDYFRSKIFDMLKKAGAAIGEDKWYSNLSTRGNTGCASLFIMLDEFLKTQSYNPGDKIICMVPESGRFNNVYMLLTVMD